MWLSAILTATCLVAQPTPPAQTHTQKQTPTALSNDATKGVRAANDRFYAALNAMFTGDLAPMNAIWSHGDDVSNQGPFGARIDGWAGVGAEFRKEANMKLGGRVVCQDVIVRAGTDMGYAVCVEEGENMTADGRPVKVRHRATNVFRREQGQWKLVHHHTDLSPELQKAVAVEAK